MRAIGHRGFNLDPPVDRPRVHHDAIGLGTVMHPGPINRGVEIESAVADGPHSVILNQVTYGIAVRMAVLSMTMSGQTAQRQFEQENAQ